jgi:hypothetical protein
MVKALTYSKAVACVLETVLEAVIIGWVVDLRTDKETPASVGHTTPVGLNFTHMQDSGLCEMQERNAGHDNGGA